MAIMACVGWQLVDIQNTVAPAPIGVVERRDEDEEDEEEDDEATADEEVRAADSVLASWRLEQHCVVGKVKGKWLM